MKRYLMNTLLLFLLFNFQVNSESKEEIAIASFIIGRVKIKPLSEKEPVKELKLNDRILAGDTVVTEASSKVTILYKGSEFKISSNSSVTIQDLYSKKRIGKVEVNHGFAWFKLVNLKGKFEVYTPVSTAGVRGTSFATMYDQELKQAMNCVCEGRVIINSREKNAKPELIDQGIGSSIDFGMSKISKADYKREIEKGVKGKPGNSLPPFAIRIKDSPLKKNCLSCHIPKDWAFEDSKEEVPRDETYQGNL